MDRFNSKYVSSLPAFSVNFPLVAADMDKCICKIPAKCPAPLNTLRAFKTILFCFFSNFQNNLHQNYHMKKITTVIIFLLSSLSLYAQQPAGNDSTIHPSPSSVPDYSGTLSKYGFAAELTTNWLNPLPAGVTNDYIGGLGLAVNLERKISIVKHNFFFAFGLGVATYDYATNATINYASTNTSAPNLTNFSYFAPIPSSVNYSKNKLNLVWLQVPLEFHLQSNPNSNGKKTELALGVRPGYLINDHTKQKGTDTSGTTYKVKVYEIQNLQQFSTMVTAKIGYDHANLFFYYNVLTLFKSGDGDATNEFGAGISMTF